MIECWYYLGDYFEIFFSGMGEWGDESSKRNLRSATTTARRDIASGIAVVRSTSDPHRDTPPGGLPAGLSCFVGQERHSPTFAVALGICSLDRANCLWRPLRGERFYLVFFGGGAFLVSGCFGFAALRVVRLGVGGGLGQGASCLLASGGPAGGCFGFAGQGRPCRGLRASLRPSACFGPGLVLGPVWLGLFGLGFALAPAASVGAAVVRLGVGFVFSVVLSAGCW